MATSHTEQFGFGDLLASATFDALRQVEIKEAELRDSTVRPAWTAICHESVTSRFSTVPRGSREEIFEEVAQALRANPWIRYADVYAPAGDWIARIGHAAPTERLILAPFTDAAGRSAKRRAA